jgi:ATP-binding cassette, subfamily B, bacterial
MKLILKYLKPYWKTVLAMLAFATISNVFSLLETIPFQWIIDQYFQIKDGQFTFKGYSESTFVGGLINISLIAVGFAFIARISKVFQDYFLSQVKERASNKIYTDGIKKSLRLPFADFEDEQSGKTLGLFQKVRDDLKKILEQFVGTIFGSIISLSFVIVYSIFYHWSIAVVFIVAIAILGVISAIISNRIKKIQKEIVAKSTMISGMTTESLRNIELVKSLGLVEQESKKLDRDTTELLNLELDKFRKTRSIQFFQGTFIQLFRTVITGIFFWLAFKEIITLGQLITIRTFSFFIFFPLNEIGTIINSYRETQVSLEKFETIVEKDEEKNNTNSEKIGRITSIEFKDVSFSHDIATDDHTMFAVNDISFKASAGESIAFVGPSGSGKTTLVKLLNGLYEPQKGTIKYNNVLRKNIDINEFREQLGLVSQDSYLFSGTIRENMLFVCPDARDEDILKALKSAACNSILERANNGLESTIGEGGIKLSGGEKQRLAIARALLRNPTIMIFDEATSALDSITEEEITHTIKEVSKNKDRITVTIAHRLSTIKHSDCIYVLEKGKYCEHGTHEELLKNKGLYFAMWRQQVGEV